MEAIDDCAVPEEMERGMPAVVETGWKDGLLHEVTSEGELLSPTADHESRPEPTTTVDCQLRVELLNHSQRLTDYVCNLRKQFCSLLSSQSLHITRHVDICSRTLFYFILLFACYFTFLSLRGERKCHVLAD